MPKPLAYSYIRMSTDTQLKGDSLRRQTERSKRYAEENGLQLVDDFRLEDIGVSAFKGDNVSFGALGKFLEAVKAGRIPKGSFLLVESFDRLSRQKLSASVSLFFDITSNGINLVTLSDNQLYKAGEAEFAQLIMSIVVMARANEESEIKSQRLAAAWDSKRRSVGAKKLTGRCPAWLELSPDRTTFTVMDDRASVIKRIFEDSANGLGTFVITRRLNDLGTAPFGSSKGWVQSYVTKILQTRAVLGEYQPHIMQNGKRVAHGDAIAGYFPAIIDEQLFLRAQSARGRRRMEGGGRKGEALRNLFTHLAKCGYCGSPMRFLNKGVPPKGGTYLTCSLALSGMNCTPTGWRYQDFERSFFLFVREIDLGDILAASTTKSKGLALDDQLIALREKRTQLENQRERTYALINQGLSVDFLATKLRECEQDLGEVDRQIGFTLEQKSAVSGGQAVSPDELQRLIDQLQDADGPSVFAQRTTLASRLREIVTKLELRVDGQGPRLLAASDLLAQTDLDATDRERVLAAIKKSNEQAQRNNRSFTVILADGVSRHVVLHNSDPTGHVAEVTVTRDGVVSGTDNGHDLREFFADPSLLAEEVEA